MEIWKKDSACCVRIINHRGREVCPYPQKAKRGDSASDNEEVIRELLDLLKKNAMKEQANDVFEICSYVDGLEKKIDSMTEELTNMQNQIKEMQEDTLVNNAKKGLTNKGLRNIIRFSFIQGVNKYAARYS